MKSSEPINILNKEIEQLDKDFKKDGNWFVLYYQASLIETVLKIVLLNKIKALGKHREYYERKHFVDFININFTLDIIDKDLYNKLEKYRKYRNFLTHELFEEATLTKNLNVEDMHKNGKEILSKLISLIG